MKTVKIPYGNRSIEFSIAFNHPVDVILPNNTSSYLGDHLTKIDNALAHPINGIEPFGDLSSLSKVVITINDKTRPVPNSILLSRLIPSLNAHGVLDANICILIASGTHQPMEVEEFSLILEENFISRFQIIPHDCDEKMNQLFLGTTKAGTPVWINKIFLEADLRIVVGDIEPHHFAGFSGGVKSAAIGLCGRETININHMLLMHQYSKVGIYEGNLLRADIEEIGQMIHVDIALNAVLNDQKQIVDVFFGNPVDVMIRGIQVVRKLCQVEIKNLYDIVIASAGGYPKDINLYQAQKAMTHASLFCRKGGKIVLVAECREGAGSQGYLDFMHDLSSTKEIITRFEDQGFSVGPHKAYQIARIVEDHEVFLLSDMDPELVKSLLLSPLSPNEHSLETLINSQPVETNIAVLPYATACIPKFLKEDKQ